MGQERDLRARTGCLTEDMETDAAMRDDEDFPYDNPAGDDVDEVDDIAEVGDLPRPRASNVPVWRLIEMTREDRFLRRELADFEDYDDLELFGDDAVELAH